MRLAIAVSVRRTAVARRCKHGDAQQRSVVKSLVEGIQRLPCPIALGSTPTDRDNRRLAHSVVNRGIDSFEKTLIRVRSEINGNLRFRSDASSDFDIEHHLAIWAVGIAGSPVMRPTHSYRADGHSLQSQLFPIGFQIGIAVAATELNQRDSLTFTCRSFRKIIEFGDLGWSIRNRIRVVRLEALHATRNGAAVK